MKLSVITGSVSRSAGGTFDAIRRPVSILSSFHGIRCQVVGTHDSFTEKDHGAWNPVEPQTFHVKGPRSFGYTSGMYAALEEFLPDLQHVHGIWMHYSLVNYRYHRKYGTPYLISPHGMLDAWALRNSGWKKRIIAELFETRHLKGGRCLHALCEAEASAIRGYGLGNPICVIPNGVDLPDPGEQAVPPWQGRVESGKKILLFLGRIHPKKGLVSLLEAWRCLKQESSSFSEWALCIAGWDQVGHEAVLRTFVQDNSLADSIMFLGPLFGPDKQAAFTHADAFILPSQSEGLPMTILEAWANRLPVLMTPACNLPIGIERDAALSVTPDPAGIFKGLNLLVSASDRAREQMGRCGFDLVVERFTWEMVSQRFMQVYSWMIGGGSRPECFF